MRNQMIGRAEEQARLRDLLDQARSGHGQFLMIIGEPGVGKSMLLNTFVFLRPRSRRHRAER